MFTFTSKNRWIALVTFLAGSSILVACQSMTLPNLGFLPWNSEDDQFFAKDGVYFPKFIHSFFKKAQSFEQGHPTLSEARQGIKVIEVKKLSQSSNQQNESNLSWSVDGSHLSYEALDYQSKQIMVRSLDQPMIKKLAVLPHRPHDFLDGLVESSIVSYNSGLSWAANGKKFAFMSNGGMGVYNIYVGAIDQAESIVARSSKKEGYPVWNPKKPEIAFVSARSGQGDIYLLNLDNQSLQRLTFNSETDLFPEWHPSGQGILYVSGPSNAHQLMMIRRTQEGVWETPSQITRTDRDHLRPKVSPDGQWVAFYRSSDEDPSSLKKSWDLYLLAMTNVTPQAPHLIMRGVVVDLNTGAAWSPDSKKVFFVKDDPAQLNPIYGYDLTKSHHEKINTGTQMNRDILMSSLGVLSFRAQQGAWDRVFVALTNQGIQIQNKLTKDRI